MGSAGIVAVESTPSVESALGVNKSPRAGLEGGVGAATVGVAKAEAHERSGSTLLLSSDALLLPVDEFVEIQSKSSLGPESGAGWAATGERSNNSPPSDPIESFVPVTVEVLVLVKSPNKSSRFWAEGAGGPGWVASADSGASAFASTVDAALEVAVFALAHRSGGVAAGAVLGGVPCDPGDEKKSSAILLVSLISINTGKSTYNRCWLCSGVSTRPREAEG